MGAYLHTAFRTTAGVVTVGQADVDWSGHGRLFHERQGISAMCRLDGHVVLVVNGRVAVYNANNNEITYVSIAAGGGFPVGFAYGEAPGAKLASCLCAVGNGDVIVGTRWSAGVFNAINVYPEGETIKVGVTKWGDVMVPWGMADMSAVVKVDGAYMVLGARPAWLYSAWRHETQENGAGLAYTRYWPDNSSYYQPEPPRWPEWLGSPAQASLFTDDTTRERTPVNQRYGAYFWPQFWFTAKPTTLPRYWFGQEQWPSGWTKGDGAWSHKLWLQGAMPRVTWPSDLDVDGAVISHTRDVEAAPPFGETRTANNAAASASDIPFDLEGLTLKLWFAPPSTDGSPLRRWLRHVEIASNTVDAVTLGVEASTAGPAIVGTGTTTEGSTEISDISFNNGDCQTHLQANMGVAGAGIPTGTTIASVDGASTITLSAEATVTGGAPTNLTFTYEASVAGYEPLGQPMLGILDQNLNPTGRSVDLLDSAGDPVAGEFTGLAVAVQDCVAAVFQPAMGAGDSTYPTPRVLCLKMSDLRQLGDAIEAPAGMDYGVPKNLVVNGTRLYVVWEDAAQAGCLTRLNADHGEANSVVVQAYDWTAAAGLATTGTPTSASGINPVDFIF